MHGNQHGFARQQWIEEMHRTEPGLSWRSMDQETRMQKADQKAHVIQTGSFLVLPGIKGTWREVGSNNLSGRLHCSDLDTASGAIYCGSSGGNIWLGSFRGVDKFNTKSINGQFRLFAVK